VRRCCQLRCSIAGELCGLDYKPQVLQEDPVNRADRLVAGVLYRWYKMFTHEKTLFARHVDINFGYVVNPPNGQLMNSVTVLRFDNVNIRSLANSNGLRTPQARVII